MRRILERFLKKLAKKVLEKQKPIIVVITGSVGKTSSKEAIYLILKNNFRARRNIKNYNNEIGVPLTIFNCETGGKNIFLWKWILIKAFFLSLFKTKKYPEVLILELAADKIGDIQYLMEIIPKQLLKAGVLTAISETHLEFFGNLENIYKEKTTIFKYLPQNAYSIINSDSVHHPKAKISYSIDNKSDIQARDIRVGDEGVFFNVENYEFFLEKGFSRHQIYPMLAGIAVAKAFGISVKQANESLKNYKILNGRGRLLRGINNSILIDDTYNSSPLALKAALKGLRDISIGKRKIAVLGDMLELGGASAESHKQIGKLAEQLNIDYLITCGKQAENIYKSFNNKDKSRYFVSKDEAIIFLKKFVQPKDIVLIKGSQGSRMEKIVKQIMFNPEKAKELLTRQSKKWVSR